MKYFIFLTVAFSAGITSNAHAQSESNGATKPVTDPQTDTKYLLVHQEADPRFITSIERIGQCELPGPPLPTEAIRVPWQIYPGSPWEKRDQGRVVMQLFFDHDWCIRKATIIQSSGHWSLDSVSLRWGMTLKWSPKKTLFTADGEPTITIPIVWGGSQRNR